MTEQSESFSPLSPEQYAALTGAQRDIFFALTEKDQVFFAANFSVSSLGSALERKRQTLQSRARVDEHDQRVKSSMQALANGAQPSDSGGMQGLAGAAGMAAAVGLGVAARKIAPEGKAAWRGVTPRDLVNPLIDEFGRKEKTDIQFGQPAGDGNLSATVFLRTPKGMLPALTIVLAQLSEAAEVQISKVSAQSMLQTLKDQGGKLADLVQDGLRIRGGSGDLDDLINLAGRVFENGVDGAQAISDLDLEDRAWETVQRAAEPIQQAYDERMAAANRERLQLESAWDNYYSCPKCRVEFSSATETTCRVCGAARQSPPEAADPRRI